MLDAEIRESQIEQAMRTYGVRPGVDTSNHPE